MYGELLDRFLSENKPKNDGPTAAEIMFFLLKAVVLPESDEIRDALDELHKEVMPERIEEAAAEKEEIEKISSGKELIRIMRRKFDALNRYAVVKKAMELESEVVPDVLMRFRNNRNEEFIEIATLVLGKSKLDMAETMIGYYDEMPNPYGQSMVLLLLGFKADESRIPWLISKHRELKKSHRMKSYHEGAWYGLLEMEERFYGDKHFTN